MSQYQQQEDYRGQLFNQATLAALVPPYVPQVPFPRPQPYQSISTSFPYHDPPQYPISPSRSPTYGESTYYSESPYVTTPERRRRGRDVWKEYMCGLGKSMSALGLEEHQARYNRSSDRRTPSSPSQKPLPPIPPSSDRIRSIEHPSIQPLPRPTSVPVVRACNRPTLEPPPIPPRPASTPHSVSSAPSTSSLYPNGIPTKSFRPTFHPHAISQHSEPFLDVPERPHPQSHFHSAPQLPRPSVKDRTTKNVPTNGIIIDLTGDSPNESSRSKAKSPARRQRATSELPQSVAECVLLNTSSKEMVSPASKSPLSSSAVRCAGFTRTGQPCKRLVKVEAPFLRRSDVLARRQGGIPSRDQDDDDDDGRPHFMGRYCKDHAGMVCQAGGFYWRGKGGGAAVWVDFDVQYSEFIPPDLGQQTQTLLRMTMESPLTAKEMAGFLYAYELRDLQTHSTSFYKVGRTDNVPRRIGQWTKQCQSHTPTLRDIFPLPLSRTPTILRPHHPNFRASQRTSAPSTSFLPGAVQGGTMQNDHPQHSKAVPAVKRWERLVHLELAERASQSAPAEWDRMRSGKDGGGCSDCGAVHKEIFPLAKEFGAMSIGRGESGRTRKAYEDVVLEVICRWERFIRRITAEG